MNYERLDAIIAGITEVFVSCVLPYAAMYLLILFLSQATGCNPTIDPFDGF